MIDPLSVCFYNAFTMIRFAGFFRPDHDPPSFSQPPTLKTRFFREAHFYFFAGSWQVALLLTFSGLAALSALTGVYLNISYWSRRLRSKGGS
jgi:hypothetical protein